jgi:hypothetical protein
MQRDRQTDGQDAIMAFRNFAKAPKNNGTAFLRNVEIKLSAKTLKFAYYIPHIYIYIYIYLYI